MTGSVRARVEDWSWFEPQEGDGEYAFGHSLLRVGVGRQTPRDEWMLEIAQPTLFNAPKDAVRPAPEGQLGLGASYRAANGSKTADLFLKQGFYRWKNPARGGQVRLGRFEFIEGLETMPQDPTLQALKRDRIAHRLIGNFGWSLVGRSFDGIHFSQRAGGGNATFLAARPTQGVFQLNGWSGLDINVLYAAYSRPLPSPDAPGDTRLFLIDYDDNRSIGKVDNRPAAVRDADRGDVHIQTLGGHYVRVFPVGRGRGDVLLWGAGQIGDWGAQRHRGTAAAIEVGYQPAASRLQPWVRAGYFRSSGDGDPNDDRHGTFFPILPTPRIYARFPFFNQMNNQDAFLQVSMKPHAKWSLRADAHLLRLTSGSDLWYQGGGAFQSGTFGYAGRPSGGDRGLASLLDLSVDYQPSPSWTATLYAAVARGRGVVENIYPGGSDASLLYAEVMRRW